MASALRRNTGGTAMTETTAPHVGAATSWAPPASSR
jgi:hypothetical protein